MNQLDQTMQAKILQLAIERHPEPFTWGEVVGDDYLGKTVTERELLAWIADTFEIAPGGGWRLIDGTLDPMRVALAELKLGLDPFLVIELDARLFEVEVNRAVSNAQLAVEGHPMISHVVTHDWGFTYVFSHPAMVIDCAVLYHEDVLLEFGDVSLPTSRETLEAQRSGGLIHDDIDALIREVVASQVEA